MLADRGDGLMLLDEMNTTETAELLGCSPQNVRARAMRKSLPGRKTPDGWRFDRSVMQMLVNPDVA